MWRGGGRDAYYILLTLTCLVARLCTHDATGSGGDPRTGGDGEMSFICGQLGDQGLHCDEDVKRYDNLDQASANGEQRCCRLVISQA